MDIRDTIIFFLHIFSVYDVVVVILGLIYLIHLSKSGGVVNIEKKAFEKLHFVKTVQALLVLSVSVWLCFEVLEYIPTGSIRAVTFLVFIFAGITVFTPIGILTTLPFAGKFKYAGNDGLEKLLLFAAVTVPVLDVLALHIVKKGLERGL